MESRKRVLIATGGSSVLWTQPEPRRQPPVIEDTSSSAGWLQRCAEGGPLQSAAAVNAPRMSGRPGGVHACDICHKHPSAHPRQCYGPYRHVGCRQVTQSAESVRRCASAAAAGVSSRTPLSAAPRGINPRRNRSVCAHAPPQPLARRLWCSGTICTLTRCPKAAREIAAVGCAVTRPPTLERAPRCWPANVNARRS